VPKFLADLAAKLAFRFARYWVLNRSDQYIARSMRIARRVVYAVSGDQMASNAIGEMAEVFAESGRGTELVRIILREATPEYAITILRSILRAD
jgi:hypothetical protein